MLSIFITLKKIFIFLKIKNDIFVPHFRYLKMNIFYYLYLKNVNLFLSFLENILDKFLNKV